MEKDKKPGGLPAAEKAVKRYGMLFIPTLHEPIIIGEGKNLRIPLDELLKKVFDRQDTD